MESYADLDFVCPYRSDITPGSSKHLEGILELMRAIVLRSIRDFQESKEHREEAFLFLTSEEDDYIFSFASICKYLNLSHERARSIILNNPTRKNLVQRRRIR